MTHMPFRFDAMTVGDIPEVMRIERRVFPEMWTSGIYQRELTANPWSHYYTLRPTQPGFPPILAYGGVWQMDKSAHIPTIATHPDYQRRGLGGYLLMELLIRGEALGCNEATLEVRASNYPAQKMYLRMGFEIVGVRYHYYRDNNEDAMIMTRPTLVLAELQKELEAAKHRLTLRHRSFRF